MSPKLTIIEQKPNALLGRTEVKASLEYEAGTPTRAEVRRMLAGILNCGESLVFVRKISPDYGRRAAKVFAVVYSSRARALEIEPDHIIARNEGVRDVGEAQGG